jgi:hypothetical protein
MDRREFSKALAAAVATCSCQRAWAEDKSAFTGCRTVAAKLPDLAKRIRSSSGNIFWDAGCKSMHEEIVKEANVQAGLNFYDDHDGPNALAFPHVDPEDKPDGTIVLGIQLMTRALPPMDDMIEFQPVGAILLAHECGHILQYKSGMSPAGPWQMEPHADFLGGVILGKIMVRHSPTARSQRNYGLSRMSLDMASQVLYGVGDTLFSSPQHHGEPDFRASMMRAGLELAGLDMPTAFEKGKRMIGLF